jgi:hypothetical protein
MSSCGLVLLMLSSTVTVYIPAFLKGLRHEIFLIPLFSRPSFTVVCDLQVEHFFSCILISGQTLTIFFTGLFVLVIFCFANQLRPQSFTKLFLTSFSHILPYFMPLNNSISSSFTVY